MGRSDSGKLQNLSLRRATQLLSLPFRTFLLGIQLSYCEGAQLTSQRSTLKEN